MEILTLHNNQRVVYDSNKELYLTTVTDTTCLRFLHEALHYPREGYRWEDKDKYTIPKDTIVKVNKVWSNFVEGTMIRVVFNDKYLDIKLNDLKWIK